MLKKVLVFPLALIGTFAIAQSDAPEQKFAHVLAEAEATGNTLFQLDLAAAHATDEVFRQTKDAAKKELKGWITEINEIGITTYFIINTENSGHGIKYSVTTTNGQIIPNSFKEYQPVKILSDEQKQQYDARQLTLKSITQPCSKHYNTVTIKDTSTSLPSYKVYAIPATDKQNIVLAGGFFLYKFSNSSSQILFQRAFSKSCLELPKPPKAEGLFTTHILDETPTEIHVYLSLINNIQFYICTIQNRYLWSIQNGKIRFVQEIKDGK